MPEFNLRLCVKDQSQKNIDAIKEIRFLFGYGLKEAKDVVDGSHDPSNREYGFRFTPSIFPKPEILEKGKADFLRYGYQLTKGINNEFVNHREVLKVIVSDALQADRFDIVRDVLALIEKHF